MNKKRTDAADDGPILPPLPRHPPRGVPITAGDKVELREFTIAVKDPNEGKPVLPPLRMGVPNWDGKFSCGATFRMRRALEPITVSIDGSIVRLSADQDAVEVALQQEQADPFSSCYQTA